MIADCGCTIYERANGKYSIKLNPKCTLHKQHQKTNVKGSTDCLRNK